MAWSIKNSARTIKSLFGFSNSINGIEFDKTTGKYFLTLNASANIQSTDNYLGQMKAYELCAPLAGIIQRKSRAFNNGKIFLMDENGKESTVQEAKKIRALIDKPNAIQSWPELMNQLYTYLSIFGEVFVYALRSPGFNEVKSLWIIPNWIMTIEETGKLFNQTELNEIIAGYKINFQGNSIDVSNSDILHIKDSIANTNQLLRGRSRMVALRDPISNIIAAYEARNVLITKRGGIGILSNNSKDVAGMIPLEAEEKDKIQKEFATYGLSKNTSQVIITSAALQWQSMTYPTKDLMLFEEIEDDVRQISDNYEYPMYLLGFKAGSTYSNVGEAKKSLYQDAIIPEAESIYKSLSTFFNTQKYGFEIKVFFDHLEILQKSEKDKAEATKLRAEAYKIAYERKAITREEFRKLAYDLDETMPTGNLYEGQPTNNITVGN